MAVSVSAGEGPFFGFHPAWKASRLDPIVALRRERGEFVGENHIQDGSRGA